MSSSCSPAGARSRVLVLPLASLLGVLALAAPAQAQQPAQPTHAWETLSLSAEWLHANRGALHRDALPSYAWGIAHDRPSGLRLELGYLRAARPATTAKGVTAGAGLRFDRGRFSVRPGVAALVGVAETNADLGGYDWRDIEEPGVGDEGHQGRAVYQRGTTLGGGLSLGAEFHLGAGVSLTGSVRQWLFSGRVLSGNRDRTLAGLGLSLRPGGMVPALRGEPINQETEQ